MRLETIHPRELSIDDTALWRAHQSADPALQSPYLTPEWAKLIGAVRDDARVCVIQDGAGFLGVQRLSRFAAMGLGAPITDYQGVVGLPNLPINRADLCRALNVGRIDITHAPAGQDLLKGAVAGQEGSWIANVAGGRDLYEAALKERRGEFVRQTDKKRRKLERDHGRIEFRAQSAERADFETLLAWKNAQLKRSGQPEIWAAPWVSQTLNACFETRGSQFGGAMFTLSIDGRLVAGAFCLRSPKVLHFWIVAHDNAYDNCSPGVQLARWIAGWAGDNGIAEIDFGPGDYQYKRQLSTGQRTLERGVVAGNSWSAAVRRAEHAVRAHIEKFPQTRFTELPGKAMRRLDLMRALHA
ncbi:MAG: GNAT family N-acetyltransferase [Hyphomonadaceae bacterium]|nr:GNAT family N-acetyltransferase [Hyphomonadaceae bacterium]